MPILYARYVDDIILLVESEDHITKLIEEMENQSVFNFIYEIGYNKLPFLDVNIKIHNDLFETSVHKKLTSTGDMLNYLSEFSQRYKNGVITTMLHTAYKISSNSIIFQSDVERIKQLFVNNNYPMNIISDRIEKFLNTQCNNMKILIGNNKEQLELFYEN